MIETLKNAVVLIVVAFVLFTSGWFIADKMTAAKVETLTNQVSRVLTEKLNQVDQKLKQINERIDEEKHRR